MDRNHRVQYQRRGLRYASDMTDAEWALIERYLPRRHRLGRPRKVVCAMSLKRFCSFFPRVASGGRCRRSFRRTTVQSYFYAWRATGRWQKIVRALVRLARQKLGRKPKPTAAVIDSQIAPTTQAGGPRGFDAGKRVHGRKRHIVTDTNGLLLAVHVILPTCRIVMARYRC